MGLVSEFRRRNVFRVAIAYIVLAWVILEAGDVLAPALHLPEWVVSALVFFLVLGFPLALIFAWAFELTPEGIKLEKHVDRSKSITHLTGRKLDYVIIGVLAVALVLFAFDEWVLEPTRDAELLQAASEAVTDQASGPATDEMRRNSIAVLPFADMSPEGNQEYFSDGISEELLNVLSRVPGLRVTARTSSFQFKGENRDIIDIGQQLNVGYILEGSVRKSENLLRITAQLIDADDGFHLWSNTYDRELENVFAVQDEISATIVVALKEQLGLQVAAAPRVIEAANTEAYEAFLRGRYLVVQRTTSSIEAAVREFQKAIALDPEYSLAHAELAIATLLLERGPGTYGDLTNSEAVTRALPHAEAALALDQSSAEAHAAVGFLSWKRGNLEEALGHFEQAIHINPNYSDVYMWMGSIHNDIGHYKEGFAMDEMAVRLDPLSSPSNWNYLHGLIARGRLDEAAQQVEKMKSIRPHSSVFYPGLLSSVGDNWTDYLIGRLDVLLRIPGNSISERRLSWQFALIGLERESLTISDNLQPFVLRWLGNPNDAVKTAEVSLAEAPESLTALGDFGLALASAGDYERARPILEEVWQRLGGRVTCCRFPAHSAVALIVIRRGAGDEAGVAELVAAIRDNVRRYRDAGMTRADSLHHGVSIDYEDGLAEFLTGEREKGLELIAKAVEDGFYIPLHEAYLQVLYDDPGFAPIRAMQEARQKRERNRFLAIVCDDNPYEAVWQPAEGTCERFAAASEN
jgi:TolB-like protein